MRNVVILGAAGRDFHNFNVFFRDNRDYRVVAFTATQIPNIVGRRYPRELSGKLYPEGIPIEPEEQLSQLIRERKTDLVVFSYSDISHRHVMERASEAVAAGADFWLLGPESTMLKSNKPVVSVTAVRTGSGKSQTTRRVAQGLKNLGQRVVIVRHPMPYGELAQQICQRFATMSDLDRYHCTIEEREEYEPHIARGDVVYAGVDYEVILRECEREADVILWDGGNNDLPFYRTDMHIVVADPHRPGHELSYWPGSANLRMAHVVVINKVDTASATDVRVVRENVRRVNRRATVVEAASPLYVDRPDLITGKRVLAVEDGPTLTHGEMAYGAASLVAQKYGAAELVDPRPYAVGSIEKTFRDYPHMNKVLPAMGYSPKQLRELEETIRRAPCEAVVLGTPVDLTRLISFGVPAARVRYELQELGPPTLQDILGGWLGEE